MDGYAAHPGRRWPICAGGAVHGRLGSARGTVCDCAPRCSPWLLLRRAESLLSRRKSPLRAPQRRRQDGVVRHAAGRAARGDSQPCSGAKPADGAHRYCGDSRFLSQRTGRWRGGRIGRLLHGRPGSPPRRAGVSRPISRQREPARERAGHRRSGFAASPRASHAWRGLLRLRRARPLCHAGHARRARAGVRRARRSRLSLQPTCRRQPRLRAARSRPLRRRG